MIASVETKSLAQLIVNKGELSLFNNIKLPISGAVVSKETSGLHLAIFLKPASSSATAQILNFPSTEGVKGIMEERAHIPTEAGTVRGSFDNSGMIGPLEPLK